MKTTLRIEGSSKVNSTSIATKYLYNGPYAFSEKMKDLDFQSAIKMFEHALSEVEDAVMRRVDTNRIKSRLGENIESINSPVFVMIEFFIVDHELEDDQGVCLSVAFQNHRPVVGGLQAMKANELFAYADLSYIVGERVSNFGIVRLQTDTPDFTQQMEETVNCLVLYFKSQIPVIVDRLNESVGSGI